MNETDITFASTGIGNDYYLLKGVLKCQNRGVGLRCDDFKLKTWFTSRITGRIMYAIVPVWPPMPSYGHQPRRQFDEAGALIIHCPAKIVNGVFAGGNFTF